MTTDSGGPHTGCSAMGRMPPCGLDDTLQNLWSCTTKRLMARPCDLHCYNNTSLNEALAVDRVSDIRYLCFSLQFSLTEIPWHPCIYRRPAYFQGILARWWTYSEIGQSSSVTWLILLNSHTCSTHTPIHTSSRQRFLGRTYAKGWLLFVSTTIPANTHNTHNKHGHVHTLMAHRWVSLSKY